MYDCDIQWDFSSYIYTYIHTRTYIHTYVCTYTHTHTPIYICVHPLWGNLKSAAEHNIYNKRV